MFFIHSFVLIFCELFRFIEEKYESFIPDNSLSCGLCNLYKCSRWILSNIVNSRTKFNLSTSLQHTVKRSIYWWNMLEMVSFRIELKWNPFQSVWFCSVPYVPLGNLTDVKRLIIKGVDVNVVNFAEWTPLHHAALEGKASSNHFNVPNVSFSK